MKKQSFKKLTPEAGETLPRARRPVEAAGSGPGGLTPGTPDWYGHRSIARPGRHLPSAVSTPRPILCKLIASPRGTRTAMQSLPGRTLGALGGRRLFRAGPPAFRSASPLANPFLFGPSATQWLDFSPERPGPAAADDIPAGDRCYWF